MAAKLYGRFWQVTVGTPAGTGPTDLAETITFGALRTVFVIERSAKPKPSTSKLEIYNLSTATRNKLTGKGLVMTLEAGYEGHSSLLLRADVERVLHRREGADWATSLEADDGSRALAQARSRISLDAGAQLTDVIKNLSQDFGVAVGNALKAVSEGNFSRSLREFTNGFAASGRTSRIFDQVMTAAGLEWSIQNNQLIITKPGDPTDDEAVVVGPDTGMIGSPEAVHDDAADVTKKDHLLVKCLIVPGLEPVRKVKIESRTFNGFARIERVKYSGDSHGDDWYAELEIQPL